MSNGNPDELRSCFMLSHEDLNRSSVRNFNKVSVKKIVRVCIYSRTAEAVTRKKGVLKNFAKFTGKHLCQSLYFDKVARLRLWQKKHWHRGFTVNYENFLRISFLKKHLRWLLLALVDRKDLDKL